MRAVLERFNPDDEVPLEARVISRMIEQAQVRVEGYHFDIRKHLVEYDDVLNRQREVVYAERRRILSADDVRGLVLARLREEVTARTGEAFAPLSDKKEYERDQEAQLDALQSLLEGLQSGRHSREESRMPLFPAITQVTLERLRQRLDGSSSAETLQAALAEVVEQALEHRRQRSEETVSRTLGRALDEEERDEGGLYLTRLYRTLTKDLRIPLPATVTAARWARMEPQEIEEEVMAAARREMEDELRRVRPRILERVPQVASDWQAGQVDWWPVAMFLSDLDYYYRLPARPAARGFLKFSQEEIEEEIYRLGLAFLEERERRLGADTIRQIERGYLLRAFDREWIDYLTAMEDLRQGIGLRAYGQQDPLVEYRRESFHLFQRLQERVREQALFYVFRASQAPVLQRVRVAGEQRKPVRAAKPDRKEKGRNKKKGPRPQAGGQRGLAATPSPAAAGTAGTPGGHKKRRRHKKR